MKTRVLSVCLFLVCTLLPIPCQCKPIYDEVIPINAASLERVIAEVAWYYPETLDAFQGRCLVDVVFESHQYFKGDRYFAFMRTGGDTTPTVFFNWNDNGLEGCSFSTFRRNFPKDYYAGRYGVFGTYSVNVKEALMPKLDDRVREMIEMDIAEIENYLAKNINNVMEPYSVLDYNTRLN